MLRIATLLFGIAAALGFGLALLVHGAALGGSSLVERWPLLWGLHAGIFVLVLPLVARSIFERNPKTSGWPTRVTFAGLAIGLLFAYALANFYLAFGRLEEGSIALRDGRYVLENHGRIVRESTRAEFDEHQVASARLFSGHWLAFYGFFAISYLRRRPPAD